MVSGQSHSGLLELPAEILLHIIERELHHEDLENFVLCSKIIYILAREVRDQHLFLKRKYGTFVFGDVHIYRAGETRIVPREEHPVHALNILLDDNVIVDYCSTLKIGSVRSDGLDRIGNDTHQLIGGLTRRLQAIVKTEPYSMFEDNQIDGAFQLDSFLMFGLACGIAHQVPIIQLQNIRSLELVDCETFFLQLHSIFPYMQKSHHRLKEVSLSTSFSREYQEFELLRRFAEIPSVRKISGFRLCDLSWIEQKAFSGGTICPGIKEIHLESSSIGYKSFENLLQYVKALEIFYYEQGTVADPQYDPRDTIRLLECFASETLETLTLVDPYSSYLVAASNGGIVSLRGFQVLKHVALDCYFFINHDREYAEALGLARQGCYPNVND
ncbi:MAG: hypothetical protein Q9180_007464, partial [Flavoplaca navasiana]